MQERQCNSWTRSLGGLKVKFPGVTEWEIREAIHLLCLWFALAAGRSALTSFSSLMPEQAWRAQDSTWFITKPSQELDNFQVVLCIAVSWTGVQENSMETWGNLQAYLLTSSCYSSGVGIVTSKNSEFWINLWKISKSENISEKESISDKYWVCRGESTHRKSRIYFMELLRQRVD